MNSINILAIMPAGLKKWSKPFLDAVLGTLKQISGIPYQKHFGMVSADMTDDELEEIKDKIIRSDIFIFVLSPDYALFEQTRGLLQLVKAREIIVKNDHKIVFSVLRETCKIPPYFLQKPLYDFIGESFNTPSFKNKYVKLIKDVVTAMKVSDNLNKEKTQITQSKTQQDEATAIPLTEEPAIASEQIVIQNQIPEDQQVSPLVEEQRTFEAPISTGNMLNHAKAPTDFTELKKAAELDESDEEFEPIDFLEPFDSQPSLMADDIPVAPQIEPTKQQEQAYFSTPLDYDPAEPDEIDVKPLETVDEEVKTEDFEVAEKPEDELENSSDSKMDDVFDEISEPEDELENSSDSKMDDVIDEISEPEDDLEEAKTEIEEPVYEKSNDLIENEAKDDVTVIDISDELDNSSLDDIDFDDFDMDASEDEDNQEKDEKTSFEDSVAENEDIFEQSELTEEKINSDLKNDVKDDIVFETLDDPGSEDEKVELNQSNELSQDNDWDSFVEEESKIEESEMQCTPIEPESKIQKTIAEDDEELEPWNGSASKYEDPDIKKKIDTESFEIKKVQKPKNKRATSAHTKNGLKANPKKNRSKRRKKILKTDADIISGEVQNDGVDVLEELGIDIDNIPDTPEHSVTKKSDTASIDELLKQEELSMDDDLSFDNELILEDAEEESIEDESVGKEFGMAQIKLADEKQSSTSSDDKDIIDELEIGIDVKKMNIPKGNCTLFMNKVPENRKEEAIKLIQEITDLDDAEIEKLLGRIVVPVLKDVFVEQAEKALDKLKRSGFNGRIRKT